MSATPHLRRHARAPLVDSATTRTNDAPPANPGTQVTSVLRHRVARDSVRAYELWLARIIACAQGAPGFLGVHVIRPAAGDHEYLVVPRFEHAAHLACWAGSARRIALLEEVQPLLQPDRAAATPHPVSMWLRLAGLLVGRLPPDTR